MRIRAAFRYFWPYRLTPGGSRSYVPWEDDELRPTWAKVPQDLIEKVLRDIPNRGRMPLASLRLYILLLTMRNNDTNVANISYRQILNYTGVRLADISKGLQILMISDFLRIAPARYDDGNGYEYNRYVLRGDFGGEMRGRMRPKSHNPTSSIVPPF